MKTSVSHLPPAKQADLAKAVELILAAGQPDMIILFGSHARGDWVDDIQEEGGRRFEYQSDFDIYVLTRLAKHIDRFARNEQLRRRLHEIVPAPVSLIADTSKHFNAALERGRYFYVDVVKEGVVLFDSGRIKLSEPRELSREERLEEVTTDFDYWFPKAEGFYRNHKFNLANGDPILAAFMLHQAVEHLTTTALLVLTSYKPKGHDIAERLRQCAALDARFGEVFPLETDEDRRRFELLREAYVGARYKKEYDISTKDLQTLAERVRELRDLTEMACRTRIAEIEGESSKSS